MSVSLAAGESVPLRASSGSLTQVRMGLGWDAARKKSLFSSKPWDVELDASAVLYNAQNSVVDQVWFKQLISKDGSVVHSGDNRTGKGEGDDESITVHLDRLPDDVATIVFLVNSFSGQDFSQIKNAFCRLVDETDGSELARYELTGSGTHTAQVMAKLVRQDSEWSMTAIGATANGITFQKLLPAITPYL